MDHRSDRHPEIARAKGMRVQREGEMGASGGGHPSGPAAMWPREQAGHKPATDRAVQTQKRSCPAEGVHTNPQPTGQFRLKSALDPRRASTQTLAQLM